MSIIKTTIKVPETIEEGMPSYVKNKHGKLFDKACGKLMSSYNM